MQIFIILLITFFCIVSNTWSAGFQLFNEGSARVMGLGAAVTGRTDLIESVWYNPSATAFFKKPEFMIGSAFVYPSLKFKSDVTGKNYEMTDRLHPLPFLYITYPVKDRFVLNFFFNVPYGLTTDWDADWEGRYEADYTSLRCYFFTPSLAVKLTDHFSIGFGPQIVYTDAELRKSIIPTNQGIDVRTKLDGNDWDMGWLFSMIYKIKDHTSIGLIYRSQITLDLDGYAKYYNTQGTTISPLNIPTSILFRNGDGKVFLDLPDTFSVGIATQYFQHWILSLDLLWSGWSTYDKLKFKYEHKPGDPFGNPGIVEYPKDWKDVFAIRFGAEYLINNYLNLRFSYVYDADPVNDNTRGAELPTNDRHLFSLGLGYNKKNLGIDFAYTYLLMKDSKPGKDTSYLRGEYEGYAHIFAFDIKYKF